VPFDEPHQDGAARGTADDDARGTVDEQRADEVLGAARAAKA